MFRNSSRAPADGCPSRSPRSRTALAALLGGLLTLTACSGGGTPTTAASGPSTRGGTPQAGGTLTVALSSIPPVIDPYATTLQANWQTARNVCEPLFDISTKFEVKPVLVDTFSYDRNVTYTVKLRSGVTFHNGAALTAADAVASIQRFLLTPGNGALLANNLASVEASGDLELTLTLKQPSAIVPTLLTTAYVMPASVQSDRPITEPANDLICTGPYKLASYQADREIQLVRYDGYAARDEAGDGPTGKKVAYADKIVFTPMPESSAQVQAVQTGAVDVTSALPLDTYQPLSGSTTAVPVLLSALSGSTVVFNKAKGVMANVKMRQAFLAALDQTQIMGAGFGNPEFYELDGSIIPKVNTTFHATQGTEAYNKPDTAKVTQLLKEAGYDGTPVRWMTTKADPTWYGPVEPAVQLLKTAGINVDLQVMDQASLIQRRTDPTGFDLFSSGIPTYADPLLLPYLQDAFPGAWTNPEKNALLTKLANEPDQAKRVQLWGQLQALIYTDVPFLKFGTTRPLLAVSQRTHFDNADALMGGYYNVWIQGS
ncbi:MULTISPECIES: ABC transporter substrate-binding protein [unclassified Micromonospora]|uniref:ABC transporter substrate-binding protein n=1 Tax=unclassified Micromonospora TaxID=2617518 RepID=UPI00362EEE02